MKTIRIRKAQPMGPSLPVESVTITVDETFPDLQSGAAEFADDAAAAAGALIAALPGGTLDALTATLLRAKAVSLVVPRDPAPRARDADAHSPHDAARALRIAAHDAHNAYRRVLRAQGAAERQASKDDEAAKQAALEWAAVEFAAAIRSFKED